MIRHIIKHRLASNPVNNRALHDYEILPPTYQVLEWKR